MLSELSRPVPVEAVDFIEMATETIFPNSWIYIFTKSRKGVHQFHIRKSNIEKAIKKLKTYQNINYYITTNGFTGTPGRIQQNLFSLNNIVIDIDCHSKSLTPGLLDQQLDHLVQLMVHDWVDDIDLLMPNAVVRTGRGLQFWWFHESLSARSNKWTWESTAKKLATQIDRLMHQHQPQEGILDDFSKIQVDFNASGASSGVFRLPGTMNVTAKKRATVQLISKQRLTLQDLKEFNKSHKNPRKPLYANKPGDYSNWAKQMLSKVEALRIMRDAEAGEETRNNYCLVYYSLLQTARYGLEEAEQKIREFNDLFKEPLTERELQNTLVSARRKFYKLSNKAIKSILGITLSEEDALDLLPKKEQQKRAKAARDRAVIKYYRANKSMKEIGELTGLSQPTIRKILAKKQETSRTDIRDNKVMDLKEKGYTGEEIAKKLHISISTVWRIFKKCKQEEPKQVEQLAMEENSVEATVDQPLFSMPATISNEIFSCNNEYLNAPPSASAPFGQERCNSGAEKLAVNGGTSSRQRPSLCRSPVFWEERPNSGAEKLAVDAGPPPGRTVPSPPSTSLLGRTSLEKPLTFKQEASNEIRYSNRSSTCSDRAGTGSSRSCRCSGFSAAHTDYLQTAGNDRTHR